LLTVLLILVTALWGWTFVVVKQAISAYGVLGFLAVRFSIGTLALAPWAVPRVSRKTLRIGLPLGVVLAAGYLLQTFGLENTTPTNCGLITGLFVFFGPFFNRLLFGVRASRIFWLAAATSVFGLFLLTGAGATRPTLGDFLTLGCAACYGLQIALLDRFARGQDAAALTFVQVATAAVLFWIIWPACEPSRFTTDGILWPSHQVWLALVLTGVVATAIAYHIQVLAQQRLPAVRAAMILTLEPAFAAVFGSLLAGDRLNAKQIAGGVLMVAAVMLSEIMANRRPRLPA
jgi:drug/metabolite transporter (DMT)-like permease